MFSTVLVAVLFSLCALQQGSFAEESYGYLIHKGLFELPCVANPIPDLCSFKHQVVDTGGKMAQMQSLRTQLRAIGNWTASMRSQDPSYSSIEICASTVQNYFCTLNFLDTCTDEYIIQNLEGVKKSCKIAERYCANVTDMQFPFKSFINCNFTQDIPPMEPRKRRQSKCEHFPKVEEGPIQCKKRNYKVVVTNITSQARTLVAAHERLARYTSDIKQECLDDVAEAICKSVAPACDRNELMVVALLSRQECERIMNCLNTTSEVENLKEGFLEMCRTMPDAYKAERIPLSLLYIPTYYNDTSILTKPATESPSKSQTSQTRNVTSDKSDDPSSPTKRPHFNTTARNTDLTVGTKNPPTQTNITRSSTDKPTANLTFEEKQTAKTVPNLKPTESLLNDTTQDQVNPSVLTKTPEVSVAPTRVFSVSTTSQPVFNDTATRHNATGVNSTRVSVHGSIEAGGKATQLSPRKNILAGFLLTSIMSIYMWL